MADELVAGAAGGVLAFNPVTAGLAIAPSIINLVAGMFGDSPEEQYKKAQRENIARGRAAIVTEAKVQRNRDSRRAKSGRRLALQSGARRDAANGTVGDTSRSSGAEVSAIDQALNESFMQTNENEINAITRLEAGQVSQPAYNFPNAVDYLAGGIGALGQYSHENDLANIKAGETNNMDDILKQIGEIMGSSSSSGGYRGIDTSIPGYRRPGLSLPPGRKY